MERPTILILGGGVMQLPAIRIARQRGWRVVLADGNPSPAAGDLPDEFVNVDLKDRLGIEAAARAIRDRSGLDGIFTAGTDFSSTVAWAAERLGLPGISFDTAMRATDKSLMRAAFEKAGVPSPRFVVIHTSNMSVDEVRRLSMPVVVKPVDNMGARGICRIDRLEDVEASVHAAMPLSRGGKVIVEEYVPGPEFSIDAIVEHGEITICGVADRMIVFPPYFVEMGHTMPTRLDPESLSLLVETFRSGVRALGITDGAAKGDVKLAPWGPVIGEIAARLSGGYMSGWTYPFASGVLPTAAGLNIAVGLPAGDLTPRWAMVSAERAFISIPGTVQRVDGFESACKLPGIKEGFLRVHTGDRVRFPTNNVEKCGNFISQAAVREAAILAAEDACREVTVVLEPGSAATAAFLFHGAEAWVPDAFPVADADVFARAVGSRPFEGSFREGASISIEPVVGIAEASGRDWQGRSLADALAKVTALTGARTGTDGDVVLGSLFWRAFLRGGVQAGVWIIETLRTDALHGDVPERRLREWRILEPAAAR